MSKFKVGDLVTYKPESAHPRNAARGSYSLPSCPVNAARPLPIASGARKRTPSGC
jgi:hypothetical protein